MLVCPAMWAIAWTCVRSRRGTIQLLSVMVGLLFLIGSGGQAFSQAPAPSLPVEWTSSIAPAGGVLPVSEVPLNDSDNEPLDNSSLLGRKHPLVNLRQSDPSGLLTEESAVEQVLGNTNYSNRQNRDEQTLAVGWNQPELRHRRLYFEDQQIERGNAQRQFPNTAAGVKFVKSLIAFPIRLVTGR